jgi:hypothetical protein
VSGDGGAAQIACSDSGATKKTKLILGTCDCYLGIAARIALRVRAALSSMCACAASMTKDVAFQLDC